MKKRVLIGFLLSVTIIFMGVFVLVKAANKYDLQIGEFVKYKASSFVKKSKTQIKTDTQKQIPTQTQEEDQDIDEEMVDSTEKEQEQDLVQGQKTLSSACSDAFAAVKELSPDGMTRIAFDQKIDALKLDENLTAGGQATDAEYCLFLVVQLNNSRGIEIAKKHLSSFRLAFFAEFISESARASAVESRYRSRMQIAAQSVMACLDNDGGRISEPEDGKLICDGDAGMWPEIGKSSHTWGGCDFVITRGVPSDTEETQGEAVGGNAFTFCATAIQGQIYKCSDLGCATVQ